MSTPALIPVVSKDGSQRGMLDPKDWEAAQRDGWRKGVRVSKDGRPGIVAEDELAAAQKDGWQSGAPEAHQASISAAPGGVGEWFKDLRHDLSQGTGFTAPGRFLRAIGAPGLSKGTSETTANLIGGPLIGPTHVGEGVAMLPEHPIKGANKIVRGVGQTAALPLAATNPAALTMAVPAIAAQHGVQTVAQKAGLDPDWSELAGNTAAVLTTGPGRSAAAKVAKPIVKPIVNGVANVARTAADAVDPDIVGIVSPRLAHAQRVVSKIGKVADKINSKPLADSPTATASNEPPPAPYALSGSQVPNAVTLTPKAPFKPKGLLTKGETPSPGPAQAPAQVPPAPRETTITPIQAKTPQQAQAQIFKKMGVAAPNASVKPMASIPSGQLTPSPNLTFAGANSGETAALEQLSGNGNANINNLRAVATQRGIKVSPADTHQQLINKIHQSMTPEEIQAFDQARVERIQPDYSAGPAHTPSVFDQTSPELNSPLQQHIRSGQKPVPNENLPIVHAPQKPTLFRSENLPRNGGPATTPAVAPQVQPEIPKGPASVPRVPVDDEDMMELLRRSIPIR